MSRYSRSKKIHFLFVFLMLIGVAYLFPQVRLYSAAWTGSSDAMMKISDDYFDTRMYERHSGLFHYNPTKGMYWMRRAAYKGNRLAFVRIIQTMEHSNPGEVVFWLRHGCNLGIPWCAEELGRAYEWGRFGLPLTYSEKFGRLIAYSNFGKIQECDNLAVELHLKKGTLKDHECALLPRSPWPTLWGDDVAMALQINTETLEIHPGITRESSPVNVAAEEEIKRNLKRFRGSEKEETKGLNELIPLALKGDVRIMAGLGDGYKRLGEHDEILGEAGGAHFGMAVEWYGRAAEAGHAESAMILVYAHREGTFGLPKDLAKSEAWFKVWQRDRNAEAVRKMKDKQVAQ